jgi:hypothetical protein
MEELIILLLQDPTPLLAGLPLKWEDVPNDKQKAAIICALHCVLNGPVGVNKETHFPTLDGEFKIKDIVNVSNKSWKGFCHAVAVLVKKTKPTIPCSSRSRNGDYWPLVDWTPAK